MEEPNVGGDAGVEAEMNLEIHEEVLPLLPKPVCHVVPETFDTCIVDAPVRWRLREGKCEL